MEHLTDIEIKRFASVEKPDEEAYELTRRVNAHIIECRECAAKLSSAISYYETLNAMSKEDFALSDIPVSIFDISYEEVALAAKELFENNKVQNI